ncbi:hypothetical protein QCA50_010217 [Cerrena zonata]|uniref:Uncharacterized protein n=1 Tax=Cerrena zonata TaxID=2478898 RepID=A0AAW0G2L0_9APHY
MSSSHPSPYNFTIEDTSSMWQYTPFGDGDSRTGWQWVFSGPGVNDQTPLCDTHPEGVSFHTTGAYGANMTLEWLGVGIYLFGTSYSPYQVTVDSDTSTPFNLTSDGILFARKGLTHKTHTIVVTVLPDDVNSLFNFDYALLTDLVPANAGVRKPIEHPATDSSLFTYTPDSAWQIKSDA